MIISSIYIVIDGCRAWKVVYNWYRFSESVLLIKKEMNHLSIFVLTH